MRVLLVQPPTRGATGTRNFDSIRRLLAAEEPAVPDVLVLPELVGCEDSRASYERSVRRLARSLRCCVVGGTHHARRAGAVVNRGVVSDSSGAIIADYEKMRPYGVENGLGVRPGRRGALFDLEGRSVAVFVCSDFWYSENFHALGEPPDVVLVPTFSVSQRASPASARALWRHMAVARAYEFAAYVGISDWHAGCAYHDQRSSGVAGMANPRPTDRETFFAPVRSVIRSYVLDFGRLDTLRENRDLRGFPWRRARQLS